MATAIADRTGNTVRNTAAQKSGRGLRRMVRRLPARLLTLVLLVVVIYPLVWLFLGSVKSQYDYLNRPTFSLPSHWMWGNYKAAWVTGELGIYIRNSVTAVLPALALVILLGGAAGFALQLMRWRLSRPTMLLFLAGIMVPSQMILLPLFTIYYQVGLTGSLWPLIITYTATGLPLTVFMMATYFRAVPHEVIEAAAIDGAGIVRIFFTVAFPIVRNAVLTVALVQFFFMWNDLLVALTFTNSNNLRTVQVGLLNFTGEFGSIQYGPLFAAICITVGGTLALFLALNQRVMKGLTGGAVKG
ncbi:carbohydrate ABC transporter permease [Trebonia kvetii]|uniref:Carbohydrate ABC transporter permease n=1 Tax=Trebonia kvetii TaxID=2480626 RepID=A0A6P2BUZ8_9ACTN|nr:carbohydrate ABC transporter permease [Trebonia kvetii]TVZ02728.1 carbohydrate ABC transporter permease [Trebonia kvetii]